MLKHDIARRYIVEVQQCKNNDVVYSYEIHNSVNSNIVPFPCIGRIQPLGCYAILITIIDLTSPKIELISKTKPSDFRPESSNKTKSDTSIALKEASFLGGEEELMRYLKSNS